jgi:hypothetical protein
MIELSASKKVHHVSDKHAWRNIQQDLRERGFKGMICGINVIRLNSMPLDRYAQFLKFLDVLQAHISKNFTVRTNELVPLTLPRKSALSTISFERLMASAQAMDYILADFVFPGGITKVVLAELPQIYNQFVAH